ncbi:MAG: hypothetical protein KGZ71_11105 [Desulfobulbaceae bacterium]|nr:hypothetical protein [Desulfobulbaceae bacterium]
MAERRIDELRMVDPVLTTLAQGYSNAALVADKLFPVVFVNKLKNKIPIFGKEAFLVRQTDRAIRASSNRIPPYEFEMMTIETRERDIETAIDYLEEDETPTFFKLEQKIAKDLKDILNLGWEKDAASLAQDATNYEIGLSQELTSLEAFDDYESETDPIAIIRNAMSAVRGHIAKYPNVMVLGDSTYQALIDHPKILERIKYSGLSKVTTAILAQILDLEQVHVGKAVECDVDGVHSDIWQDNIVLAYVDDNQSNRRSEFNPSFGYTFRRENMPEVDSYFENGGKMKVVRCTDNYSVNLTSKAAGFLIKHTNHSSSEE